MNLTRVLALMALCTVVVFSSCKKDDDNDSSVDRALFVGSYDTDEDCDGATDDYILTIVEDGDDDGIIINNIYGFGATTKATVDGNDLTIDDQEFSNYGGVSSNISGSGTIADSILTINFSFNVGGVSAESCVLTCTKQ